MSSNEVSLDKLYLSIGRIAAMWADIEVRIEMVLHQLTIGIEDYSSEQDFASHILMAHMDIRQKAAAVSYLAFHGPGREHLFNKTKKLMDLISNDLRNSRNRIVHDEWTIRDREIIRKNKSPKISRSPRSGDWQSIYFQETRYKNTEWIEQEVRKFEATLGDLSILWREIRDDRVRVAKEVERLHEGGG